MLASIWVTCPACEKNVELTQHQMVIVVDMTESASYAPGAYTYICPSCNEAAWVPESSLNLVRLQAAGVPVSKIVRSELDRSRTSVRLTAEDIVAFRIDLMGSESAFRQALDEWLEGE